MESNVTVHRVVRDGRKPGQYIEPHSHPLSHYLFGLTDYTRMHAAEMDSIVLLGGLAVIPPEIEHSIHSLDDSCSLNIKFTYEGYLAEPAAQLSLSLPWVGDYRQVLLRNLLKEIILQQAGSAGLVGLWIYKLLLLLNRAESAVLPAPPVDIGRNNKLKKTLEPIVIHPNLSVAGLTAACGYHENYLSSFFKEAMGCTPRHCINLQKINKAKDLLSFSNCNVTQAAEQLKLSCVYYLSRVFHQLTDITSSEYLSRDSQPVTVSIVHNGNMPVGILEFLLHGLAS